MRTVQSTTTAVSTMPEPESEPRWSDRISTLAAEFAERALVHDEGDVFVEENYRDLKEQRFFAAAIPEELGGGGVAHREMCDLLRIIGRSCGSTALACSMHQHLLAAMIWKWRRGDGGEETLQRIAENQPILVSTGARDWLESNGEVERVEGGYRVTATKHFASQSAVGDLLVTSAPFEEPGKDPTVLHFAIPFSADRGADVSSKSICPLIPSSPCWPPGGPGSSRSCRKCLAPISGQAPGWNWPSRKYAWSPMTAR